MAHWEYTLDVKSIWNDFEEVGFEDSRDQIIRKIKDSLFWDEEDWSLTNAVDEMEWSEDLDDFNYAWEQFYDWADAMRVWVKTF